MIYKKLLAFVVLILSVLLGACAHNEIYRGELNKCISDALDNCEKNAIAHHFPNTDKEFHLGFIEYDDQGQLRDREQMKKVLDTYSVITGTDDVIVIVFVHGWQHNAAPGDSNVESFKQLLTHVSQTESVASQQDKRAKRKVLGAYIGWRGDASVLPILKYTTFWSRKYTALQVGLLGVNEVILKLARIVNLRASINLSKSKVPSSKIAVIGHSFGAQVVFTALQSILENGFIDPRGDRLLLEDYKIFGNIVILLNPAFEALRFATLFDMSQDGCQHYPKDQTPRLVMLTSESDAITRYIFPYVGRNTILFESHQKLNRLICTEDGKTKVTIDEAEADRATIGHYEPYQTHWLSPSIDRGIRKSDFNYRDLKKAWIGQSFGERLNFDGVKLTHLGRTHPLNPFLNIYVDGSLIKDHNDVWGKDVMGFLRDLLMIGITPNLETSE